MTNRDPNVRSSSGIYNKRVAIGLVRPKGADIGCGAGRYVLSMVEMIPNLSLACADASPAMLEQVDGLLRANGIDAFETRRSSAEGLEPGGYDFVSSFNDVHHFDFPAFLRGSREGLAAGGRLFVYSRLPEHNARSIWGRYIPGFLEKETRLLTLGALHGAIENTPGLRFVDATYLRHRRQATLDSLIEQARSRHYSTFSLYEPDAFEDALRTFRAVVARRLAAPVEWHDENILVHAVRDEGRFDVNRRPIQRRWTRQMACCWKGIGRRAPPGAFWSSPSEVDISQMEKHT